MKIKKVTIHFWIEKSTSYLFKRHPNWNEETVKRTKRLSIVKAVRCCSNSKYSKIDLPSCRREFFNKIICTKRRYIWCASWCSSSNRSWRTKLNGKRNTNKVQKHCSRKHHALFKFVRSLPQKIESSKKSFGHKTRDIQWNEF